MTDFNHEKRIPQNMKTILDKQLVRLGLGVVAAALSICAHAGDLPDPALTPGAINSDVTQDNIHNTVCVRGWTKTVRPPAFYTNRLKKSQIREYGYGNASPRDFEEDHLIPLSVGGHPTDPRNLWPQPRNSEWNADRKDDLEFAIYMGLCRGEVTLEEARRAFASNWITAYRRYGALLQRYRHGQAE